VITALSGILYDYYWLLVLIIVGIWGFIGFVVMIFYDVESWSLEVECIAASDDWISL
jgi:hypothetical protein